MRTINKIVIHCSATPPDMDIGALTINSWHIQRGWSRIGYHAVIKRNGRIEDGRSIEVAGAHVKGYNAYSIGVCMIGGVDKDGKPEANFTAAQYESLWNLVSSYRDEFPEAEILGHRDLNSHKECPCFNVKEYFEVINGN